MSEELKACPFCGSKTVGDSGILRHVIKCHKCGAKSAPFSKWEEAVRAWNSRSFSAAQAHAEELFEAVSYVLLQLRLAFMGFSEINIDANKLQSLYDKIADEETNDD